MGESPITFLFPSTAAVFPSDYPLAESVERLRAVTLPLALSAWTDDTAKGVVTVENVRLERVMGSRSVYRQVFVGSFREGGQGTVLSGVFTTLGWSWTWDKLGLGFMLFILLISLPSVLSHPADLWRFLLVALVILVLGVGDMKFKQWFGRGDVGWLSQVITQALTESTTTPPPPRRRPNPLMRWLYDLDGR